MLIAFAICVQVAPHLLISLTKFYYHQVAPKDFNFNN